MDSGGMPKDWKPTISLNQRILNEIRRIIDDPSCPFIKDRDTACPERRGMNAPCMVCKLAKIRELVD